MLRRAQPARLLAVDRDASGTRLLVLGRDEAVVGKTAGLGLQVPDPSVADRHAMIRYARGRISVLDRNGLQKRSCECYAVVKKEYDRLLPEEIAA